MHLEPPVELASGRRPPPSEAEAPAADKPKLLLCDVPVLLIEDDSANARLLSLLLRSEGARVGLASTAEAGLASLQLVWPRVIVLDLILPRMSGLLFVEQLKANPQTRDIPIVAVTSMNGPDAKRLVLDAGCAAYIRKPIDVETFAQIVAGVVVEAP
jgi:CheY-like chemotaxis protein